MIATLAARDTEAQFAERPHLVGSGQAAVDCSGRSIKNMRVRAIHTDDAAQIGGTAYLLQKDPFLAYQLGRNLNFREFRSRDGVFNGDVGGLGGPMPDGTTAKITARNQTSCLGCHNLPTGNPGGGTNFSKDSGVGRNAPHYYGSGLVEMLAIQVRADILSQVDTNLDGWVSASEAAAGPDPVLVDAQTGGPSIDYGSPRLDGGTTGSPALNNIFRVWYVDQNGVQVPGAKEVDGGLTFGYNFEMVVWGWGQGPGRAGLNPTNRAFYWDPAVSHSGMEAYDPSTTNDPDGDGVSLPTLAGALQFPATHKAPDGGSSLDPLGFSLDDPDGDGHLNELSEGDLDLAEWFMLHTPRPAFAGTAKEYGSGLRAMQRMGCVDCHVPDWTIEAQGPVFAGDRRVFDLDVTWDTAEGRLEGELVPLYTKVADRYVPNRGAFQVRGLFSDLAHHEMGPDFAETDFGGTVNTVWRTPPLWGVGSGFPWGHDGRSLTLEDAVLRHGGEAATSKAGWLSSTPEARAAALNLLEKLVLYDIESMPTDMDGDGVVSPSFVVQGIDTGTERFNPEWLFVTPLAIQGPIVNQDGVQVTSFAGTNLDAAYGQLLPLRLDTDADGWPDLWDNAPTTTGFQDGVH